MEKLSVCRICLAEDVRMLVVANKNMQEIYEKLTDVPFVTKDRRPTLACSFCYAKLEQCSQFMRKCLYAEELFAQMLSEDYEEHPLIYRGQLEFCGGLVTTPIEHINIANKWQVESSVYDEILSDDVSQGNIDKQDNEVSQDEDESQSDDDIQSVDDSESHDDSQSDDDSQDYTEELNGEHQNDGSPVAKKSKLPTITAKQKKNELLDSKIIRTIQNLVPKSETPITITKCSVDNSIMKNLTEIINNFNAGNKKTKVKSKKKGSNSDEKNKHQNLEYMRIHTGQKRYKCQLCDKYFRLSNLSQHILTHTGEKPHKCFVCQRTFAKKWNMYSHFRRHTGEKPYKCDICQHTFSAKVILDRHIRVHTGEKPFKCDVCQRDFRTKVSLVYHMRTHTGEKPYKCDVCDRRFSIKVSLVEHMRTHTGEKPYTCDFCELSFTFKRNLKSHINIHTGEKPYKCETCQRSFRRKDSLKCHIRVHRKDLQK